MRDLRYSVRVGALAALAGIGIVATMSGCALERQEPQEEGAELVGTAEGAVRRIQLEAKLSMINPACKAAWPGATEPGGKCTFRFIVHDSGRADLVNLCDLELLPNTTFVFTAGDIRKGTPSGDIGDAAPFLKGAPADLSEGAAGAPPPGTLVTDAAGKGRTGFGYVVLDYSLKAMAGEVVWHPEEHFIDLRTETCPDGFLSGTYAYPTGG
ncbi:hypothetical protein [Sorangium sp. So ce131]|uniref:hypothetical protein n=1 Tax=Sorangium sp. So ce131 TaxID=3133282 RepID=UPI003F5E08B5